MIRRTDWLFGAAILGLVGGLAMMPSSRGGDIGYIEDFALAKDRTAALKQLIPGTEDYYYYNCLHLLNTEQFEKITTFTRPWFERFNATPRFGEIWHRYHLLNYEKNPKDSLDYLKSKLGLRFDHQKETVATTTNLASALDQKSIARETLKAQTFTRTDHLNNFEDAALDWVAEEKLSWENRRQLLSRLTRPDIANLPKLIVDDLQTEHATPFGTFPIHRQLTLAQLEELVKLQPGLLDESAFVTAYLGKLHPGADDDWKRERPVAKAYFERLQAFVSRLAPVHNPLKAHVLYHRLAFDRAEGIFDRERFKAYLLLPRNQGYMAKRLLETRAAQDTPATLTADYSAATGLPPVNTDEPLVRSYLEHFFAEATGVTEYLPYIDDVYLRHLFAETKLVLGLGDGEKWASQLPPEQLKALKDRVDIDFAFTNKPEFGVAEAVQLKLFVKNTPNLLVKIYEINTKNFYRNNQKEIDTDINLDGLVANAEFTIAGGNDPFRRTPVTLNFPDPEKKVAFPEANRSGVYVIDLIGGGKSSRALVRKGKLRSVVTTGSAGQYVRVVDEKNTPVNDATAWLGGQDYTADKDGIIVLPFSTNPGRRPIVLSRGEFASLDYLPHQAENYAFASGFHIDREQLISQRLATLILRPGLTLNGTPISVKLLEDVRLRLTSVDLDGIPTSLEVPDFKLFEDRETTHEFRVPPRLQSLQVTLTAKIKSLSTGKTIDLSVGRTFGVNGIAKTDKIEDLHLAKFGDDYAIELLGRTGESRTDRAVHIALKHREFKELVHATLKTDNRGRVSLGRLLDITAITATGPEGVSHTWYPSEDRHTYRQLIHVKLGEVVRLPYLGTAGKPTREELALFDIRGADIRRDLFEKLKVVNGSIEIAGLTSGDYELKLKRSGETIRIRVAEGVVQNGSILGKSRDLQLPGLPPVQIESITSDAETVTIKLKDFSKFARVHVFATRYQPEFSAYADLASIRDAELNGNIPGYANSVYLTGRNIGDEYRYVLERKDKKKYPGNMLDRPALLLNPWAVRTTETGEQLAAAGDEFAGKREVTEGAPLAPPAPKSALPESGEGKDRGPVQPITPDLDYLAESSAVALNLTPDEAGLIKLPRKGFGPHGMVEVLAVDPLNTTFRRYGLPEQPTTFLDLRLKAGLDPSKHFAQQKKITVLEANQILAVEDPAGSRFEAYDHLGKVFALYATLSKDPKLTEFAFLLKWPKLKEPEKRELYSKYSCHELNFFLFQKDKPFFEAVIKPYIANKKDKTFLDRWLLGENVGRFAEAWNYQRLNIPERVLLSRKLDGEAPKTARHLQDLLKLIPPATDRDLYLFDVGVASSKLDDAEGVLFARGDGDKLDPAKREEMKQLEELQKKMKPGDFPAGEKPPMGGPGGPGGGGGGMGGFGGLGGPGGPPGRPGEGRAGGKGGKSKDAVDKLEEKLDENKKHFDDRRSMGVPRALYRKLDPTMEWAENNYYKLLIQQQTADLVSVNPFWADYAAHDGKTGFLSSHFAAASRNFTEMMFSLAVLDLPFEAPKNLVKFDGGKMTFTPAGRTVAFHEEVRPAEGAAAPLPILVSQNFYRNGARHITLGAEVADNFVADEFLSGVVYGGQIVVTNPTSSRQKLTVLVQLPVGSLPVGGAKFTKSQSMDLEPYRTQTLDYLFYFPIPGRFAQFPVHVSKNEQNVASAKPFVFNVLPKPSKMDTTTWDYISQNGSNDEVFAFLNRENVRALNLDKIAFRMNDRAFFDTVLKLLQDRHLYQSTLYSYGVFHADVTVSRQFLLHADAFVNECGGPIESPLLAIDPVARHSYEHLEYKPLVNARAHALGNRRQIVNDRFYGQYHHILKTLSYRRTLDDTDLAAVTYYLLLQDRIEEALECFGRVNRSKVATPMQYDYCAAYLELFRDDPKRARAIIDPYLNYPVDKWKITFTAIKNQLDEIEGKIPGIANKDDLAQQQALLAATEPSFEVALDGQKINISHQNLEGATINFYPMDVELLFSTNPFVTQSGGQFSTIRPNKTELAKFEKGQTKTSLKLPAEFATKNVLVEVTAAGKTRAVPYYAAALTLSMTENYGHLKVNEADAGKALAKVYVKVYAKLADGTVKFHKDGYTDLRGRFDYVSVNTPERQAIERFSVLVLSDEKGAVIREVAPPQK